MSSELFGVPHKSQITVEKFIGDDTSGDPDEVVTQDTWHEADGTVVIDPARIAELEKHINGTD